MTERIKLTEDSFLDHDYGIRIECNDNDRKILSQQILDDQEKAEKFDEELKQFLKTEDYNEELLIKNEELTEKLEKIEKWINEKAGYTSLEKILADKK